MAAAALLNNAPTSLSYDSLRHNILTSTGSKLYLCYFLHRHLEFRVPELQSLLELVCGQRLQYSILPPQGEDAMSPFWYLRLPNDDVAKEIAKRSMLIKGIYELWGEGSSWQELECSLKQQDSALTSPYMASDVSFKIVVDGWGHSIDLKEQVQLIEKFQFLPFKGPIRLKNPQQKFLLVVVDPSKTSRGLPDTVPHRLYFGREVALSQHGQLVRSYALPQRRYLGPTTMDTEMAFIMCNLGLVRRGCLVLDPFVGTGSILIAAAHLGALTLGTDIDVRVVRDGKVDAKGKPINVWSNFKDYRLTPPVGLLRVDVHRHPFRSDLEGVLDAVVCDPPYGVRAGGRKSAPKPYKITQPSTHIPATDPYTLGECLRDLLDLAARLLRIGGRLVYFFPATPELYKEEEIPSHPALERVHNCEQMLTSRYSRRLISMQKMRHYDATAAQQHHQALGDPRLAIDLVPQVVYEATKYDDNGKAIYSDRMQNKQRFRGKTC